MLPPSDISDPNQEEELQFYELVTIISGTVHSSDTVYTYQTKKLLGRKTGGRPLP